MTTTTTERWTYLGLEWRTKDLKLTHVWRDAEGTERAFGSKNIDRFARVGAIYDLHVTRDEAGNTSVTSGRSNGPVYVGMTEDTAELATLQANSRAQEAAARVHKEAKADMSRDAVAELLAPLKAEYLRRNHTGRRALLAVVIEGMTS